MTEKKSKISREVEERTDGLKGEGNKGDNDGKERIHKEDKKMGKRRE
jgi:hypothetical protein